MPPKLKDVAGTSFKKWSIEVRGWERGTNFTPYVRLLKILDSIPNNLKGLFLHTPDDDFFGPGDMELVMNQIQIECGLRTEDEFKDIMSQSMETTRRRNKTIQMWFSRVEQAWLVAEINRVCHNPDITKIYVLEQ